ncbi:MAG: hypothetical protein WBW04_16385 [Nitrolancea sp.]
MIGHEARKPNPALKALEPLVGTWSTVGTHPLVPGTTFHGRSSFEWIEGGAFLLMRSEIDEPEIPSGIAIFGSDDAAGELFMSYFDEREISRKYDVAVERNVVRWWRDSPDFSQRVVLTIAEDGKTIHGQGEMSRDGGAWEPDLQLTYSRVG